MPSEVAASRATRQRLDDLALVIEVAGARFSEHDDGEAQYFVGQYFENGTATDIDLTQALFWYRKAAAQGDREAREAADRLS